MTKAPAGTLGSMCAICFVWMRFARSTTSASRFSKDLSSVERGEIQFSRKLVRKNSKQTNGIDISVSPVLSGGSTVLWGVMSASLMFNGYFVSKLASVINGSDARSSLALLSTPQSSHRGGVSFPVQMENVLKYMIPCGFLVHVRGGWSMLLKPSHDGFHPSRGV